jgi:DNA-directed RNA polymerase subunit RPC12/RpoP
MGSIVNVSCACGVYKNLPVGGGMSSFGSLSYFPYACEDCKLVVAANSLDEEPTCPKCSGKNLVRYDSPSLLFEKGDKVTVQWGDLELTNGTYICAECGKPRLEFRQSSRLWD